MVPDGSTVARETYLAAWNAPLGRLEHDWRLAQRGFGKGGLVGADENVPLGFPLFTLRIGGQPIQITLPLF